MFQKEEKMNYKIGRLIVIALVINILFAGTALAVCYEAENGKLQSGSIDKYIHSIIRTYENDVPNGTVYTVQKNQGYYFKICDEAEQVGHFMEKWVYTEVPKGDWQPILTTQDKNKINIINKPGIYKIRKERNKWKVWTYYDQTSSMGNTSDKKRDSVRDISAYGQVVGVLIDSVSNKPMTNLKLKPFATKKVVIQGMDMWAEVLPDYQYVKPDQNGRFVMKDVPSGVYSLLAIVGEARGPGGEKLPRWEFVKSTTGNTIKFEVKPGQVTDVGKIEVLKK
jgi:hypothetical protein